jgi:DNA polymerase I-like protein with 3'-5' exonuclease and polymerase domains
MALKKKKDVNENQTTMILKGGRFDPEIYKTATWRPPTADQLPSSWSGAYRVGFDYETRDEMIQELGPGVRRRNCYIVGYSFCLQDHGPEEHWPRFYVPVRHGHPDIFGSSDDNVQFDGMGYLRDQMHNFEGDIVGANLPYEIDWSLEDNITFPKVKRFLDVQVADPLLYELHNNYSLEHICRRRDLPGKEETLLREAARQYGGLDPKGDMWKLPARFVGAYAEIDSVRPCQIMLQQEKEIEEQGIQESWDMECKILPILVRMTRRGVPVDSDRLDIVEEWTKRQEAKAYEIIKHETGVQMEVGHSGNVDLLKRVLDAAGIPLGVTATGKESVAKDVFAGIDHPVARALARARQVSTVRTTFVAGTRRHITPDGKIHCTFNQIRKTDDDSGESSGVAYGRLSASHVNMQNQPGNSRFSGDNELGPMWRSIYGVEEGRQWGALDLKQQEPKWSFHYGAILEERGVEGVRGALALCEKLRENPMLDTYEPIVELAGVPRSKAKVIWLARAYGQGDGGLCTDLGLPTRTVKFSKRIFYDALDQGYDKYTAKAMATVPKDSPEGQAATGFEWEGAGEEGLVIINKFDTEMSFLKVAAGIAKDKAAERGYVMLLSGRRCHFEKGPDGKYEWTHKAFNRIIQGTSSEQTKRIMIAVDEAGYGDDLMLQVHDEVDCAIENEKHAENIAEVMRYAVPMKVPTVVDVEIGPSWGESMGVEYMNAEGKKSKIQYKWGMRIENGVPNYYESPISDVRVG